MVATNECFLKCNPNQCVCEYYPSMVEFMKNLNERFSQPIVMYMEDRFEDEQNGNFAQKERFFQSQKQFNKSLQGAQLVSSEMYDQQLKMTNLNVNMRFLLKNAHNNESYPALGRYFAEYAFYAQKINRMGKNSSHNFVIDFVKNTDFLTYNYFDFLFETVNDMHEMVKQRMNTHPEQYERYNTTVYLDIDKDKIKDVYKSKLSKLKEEDKNPVRQ